MNTSGIKRRAIIRLALLLLCVGAVLSVAAYTVQKQNELNATEANPNNPYSGVPSTQPVTQPVPPTSSVPVNDAINTDTASVQYKTVSGNGVAFEAPLSWNSFKENNDGCTIENIVDSKNTVIAIWPDTCAAGPSYQRITDSNGYRIGTTSGDPAVYDHVVATFRVLP
jgi:hypothetical protein